MRYSIDIKDKSSWKMKYFIIGFICIWGVTFMSLGIKQFRSAKPIDAYTQLGIHKFRYSHTEHKTHKSSSGRRFSRTTSTKHRYIVTYKGIVNDKELEYPAKTTNSKSSADSFIAIYPTINVQVFKEGNNYTIVSMNETLEEFLKRQKLEGKVKGCIGGAVLVINLIVAFFILRKRN